MSTKGKNEWFKSSYSQGQGACLEVNVSDSDFTLTRDSKLSESPVVALSATGFSALVEHAKTSKI